LTNEKVSICCDSCGLIYEGGNTMFGYSPGLSEKIWSSNVFWIFWAIIVVSWSIYKFKKRK
jgi:hypothetical protein